MVILKCGHGIGITPKQKDRPARLLLMNGLESYSVLLLSLIHISDEIYACALNSASLPKSPTSKLLIQQQVAQLKAVSQSVAAFQQEMRRVLKKDGILYRCV